MNLTLETTIVLFTILLTGLTAGLCFTWTNAVTPGIGQLDDLSFLRSFQEMNRAIINPLFIVVFFGPFIGHILLVYLKHQNSGAAFWIYVVAAMLFILGVVFVTIFRNVPLNEVLDKMDLAVASLEDVKALRQKFETPWRQWHFVRTLSSILSFVLLLLGLILNQQPS
ncbi:MAG: DUF1772 domain-containing protein [Flavobacteriaceae bacterium]